MQAKWEAFRENVCIGLNCEEKRVIDCFPLTKVFLNEKKIYISKLMKKYRKIVRRFKRFFQLYFQQWKSLNVRLMYPASTTTKHPI